MPTKTNQSQIDRTAYIPENVNKAISDHINQTMPANLKRYMDADNKGYIPPAVERAIAQQITKSMPDHLKQYSGAYLQQSIMQPNVAQHGLSSRSIEPTNPPQVPSQLRRDHSQAVGQQFTVETDTLPLASKSMFETNQNNVDANVPSSNSSGNPTYDFIMQPQTPKKEPVSIPGLSGIGPNLKKVLFGLVILFIFVIIISIAKNILSGASNVPAITSVLQDQTEISHLVTFTSNFQDISVDNKYIIATLGAAIPSSSTDLIKYMVTNGHKINAKNIILKINKQTDTDLSSADAAGNFNPTFDSLLTKKLNIYGNDLSSAYKLTKGSIGKSLLNGDYIQAQIILKKLATLPSS